MRRVKVNLTLDADVTETARSLGLNMSRLAEAAIAEAAKRSAIDFGVRRTRKILLHMPKRLNVKVWRSPSIEAFDGTSRWLNLISID